MRRPDFFVLTEAGRVPCFLQGTYREDMPSRLVGCQPGKPVFLVDAAEMRLVTWSGVVLDIPIEPATPPTDVWVALTNSP